MPQKKRGEKNDYKKIGGLVALALGIVGCAYSAITYTHDIDWWYDYDPPSSAHEFLVIGIAVIGIIAIIAGIVLISRKDDKNS